MFLGRDKRVLLTAAQIPGLLSALGKEPGDNVLCVKPAGKGKGEGEDLLEGAEVAVMSRAQAEALIAEGGANGNVIVMDEPFESPEKPLEQLAEAWKAERTSLTFAYEAAEEAKTEAAMPTQTSCRQHLSFQRKHAFTPRKAKYYARAATTGAKHQPAARFNSPR